MANNETRAAHAGNEDQTTHYDLNNLGGMLRMPVRVATPHDSLSAMMKITQVKADKPFSERRLGCYVNGVLKFQSHDTEAVRAYADRKMQDFRNNVWLARVGSFVTK